MNTVIKGTKTIAEYKRVREDMENLARANYARHKEAFEEWGEGEPVKAWFDFEGNFCIEYESGKWWHYNDKPSCSYYAYNPTNRERRNMGSKSSK